MMKNSKEKSERKVLGKIIEAEINSSENPDMKLVRECAEKVEATAGKLTESELEAKLASITGAQGKTVKTAPSRFKKRKLLISIIAASLAVVMATAVAASPTLWGWLTFPFTRDSGQLTEVPEGYVGIYKEADLDLIRNDPDGNFILMADIDLGGKAHTPIGDYLNPFDGKFNGNGHVISNFTITASGAAIWEKVSVEEYEMRYKAEKKKYGSGEHMWFSEYELPAYSLFGIDGRFNSLGGEDVQNEYDLQYISAIGLFGNAGNATITGLGVENATITVSDADYTAVGVIAGQVGYISSCYVKDSNVTVGANTTAVEEYANGKQIDIFDYMHGNAVDPFNCERIYSISAGILCGEAFAIDSCYTDGELTASGNGSENINYSTLSAGLIAGYGGSAVSSYSTANVNIEGNVFESQGILGKKSLVPSFIYVDAYRTLINDGLCGGINITDDASQLNKAPGDVVRFSALFSYDYDNALLYDQKYANIGELEEIFFVSGLGTQTDENFCFIYKLWDRYARMTMQNTIDKYGDIPVIEQLYKDEGMRIGTICCYTPEGKEKADFYEGFDFSDVWTMKGGMPELKIFG